MRSVLASVLVFALVPTVAAAGPITAGVGLGVAHSEADTEADASSTVGLFGRVGFSRRLSGQLEVAKIQHDDESTWGETTMRYATALLVVDLKDGGAWMPMLLVGAGLDRQTSVYSGFAGPVEDVTSGHHIEGGFGLEYRAAGGLTIGADVRMGGRSLDNDYETQPVGGGIEGRAAPCGGGGEDVIGRLPAPAHLSEGEYRSARITLGIRF